MRVIFLKELLDYLSSVRFHVCFLLIFLLMAANGIVYSRKYQKEQAEYYQMLSDYEEARHDAAKKLNQFTHQMEHVAVKPPFKLAFLAGGGQGRSPNAIKFSIFTSHLDPQAVPEFNFSRNYLLRPFLDMDWVYLVGVGLSFVIIVLVYDAVCGEKERGTLGLMLSHPVERWKILWGKFAAVMVTLSIAFVTSAAMSLLILSLYGGFPFTSEHALRLVVFSLLSMIYFALFTMFGLLISSFTTRAVTSLFVGFLVWVTLIFIPPTVGLALVQHIYPLPTPEQSRSQLESIDIQIRQEFKGKDSQWRGRKIARSDNYADERISNTANQKRYRLYDEILARNLRQKFAQLEFVRNLSMISPAGVFKAAAEALTGSGIMRERHFLVEQRRFRESLREFVQATDASDPDSPHLLYNGGYMSTKPVDPSTIPTFQFREASLVEGAKESLHSLAILIIETLLLFTLGHMAFLRYDPR